MHGIAEPPLVGELVNDGKNGFVQVFDAESSLFGYARTNVSCPAVVDFITNSLQYDPITLGPATLPSILLHFEIFISRTFMVCVLVIFWFNILIDATLTNNPPNRKAVVAFID